MPWRCGREEGGRRWGREIEVLEMKKSGGEEWRCRQVGKRRKVSRRSEEGLGEGWPPSRWLELGRGATTISGSANRGK